MYTYICSSSNDDDDDDIQATEVNRQRIILIVKLIRKNVLAIFYTLSFGKDDIYNFISSFNFHHI
jgi:hypothetical protein